MNEVEHFEDVYSKKFALVEFFTTWCGPCKIQKKILQDFESEISDVFVTSIDIENVPSIASELKIQSVPTMIFFENGKEKGRLNGLQKKEKIKNLVGMTVTV